MVLFVDCEAHYIFLMWEASFEKFCMILVWVLRNHTNHIWPSVNTKNFFSFFFVFLPKEVRYMVLFVDCETHYIFLMWEASFENFCMILVCVLRNHTNHIWPSMITKKKIFFYPLCIFDCYFFRISNQEHSDWSLLRVDFFLYDPCMTTKKSYKSYMT